MSHFRELHVGEIQYLYRVSRRGTIVFRQRETKWKHVTDVPTLLGITWHDYERAGWKGNPTCVPPGLAKAYLSSVLEGRSWGGSP